jgi:hypothetical protein
MMIPRLLSLLHQLLYMAFASLPLEQLDVWGGEAMERYIDSTYIHTAGG